MKKEELINAIKALENGEIIVYPTDTLYALGANIFNEEVIKKLFRIKKRPLSVPLPVSVFDSNDMNEIAYINKRTKIIINNFLPGPLTLLLKKKKIIPEIVTSGRDTIALRNPNNKIALELLSKTGPITATSANIHGKNTGSTVGDLKKEFKNNVSIFLDNGVLDESPSTILDLTTENPIIIRQGSIKIEQIMKVIKNE